MPRKTQNYYIPNAQNVIIGGQRTSKSINQRSADLKSSDLTDRTDPFRNTSVPPNRRQKYLERAKRDQQDMNGIDNDSEPYPS